MQVNDDSVASLYDATVRIVCEEPSHPSLVVATYRHFIGDGRPLATGAQRWHWVEALSYGGGPIQPETGQRLTRHRRKVNEDERAGGWPADFAEAGPKRFVSDFDQTSDVLECAKCGLRRLVNRQKLEALLDRCMEIEVWRLRLGDLVARLS